MNLRAIAMRYSARTTARVTAVLMLGVAVYLACGPASAAGSGKKPADPATSVAIPAGKANITTSDANALFRAIVKVETRAVPDARSAAALGEEREGNGVVIGKGGLILTIGYLIVEADEVNVTDSSGRTLPASRFTRSTVSNISARRQLSDDTVFFRAAC